MKKDIVIRKLNKKDNRYKDRIIELLEKPSAMFYEGMEVEPAYRDKEQLKKIFSKGLSFGAFKNKELIGFAIASDNDIEIKLHDIIVEEKYWKNGIGTRFMVEIHKVAKKRHAKKISFCTDTYNYRMIKMAVEKLEVDRILPQNVVWIDL